MAKHKIRIVFKSGYAQDIECDEFSVTRDGLGAINKMACNNCEPNILDIQLGHVSAVFQIK